MNYKVGILIPSTSRDRDWTCITESYLYKIFLKSFLLTYNQEYEYIIYIGIDRDDKLLSKLDEQNTIIRFVNVMKNVDIKFITVDTEPGYVTEIWNILCKRAYNEGCDYFYQAGDDIEFMSKDWVKMSILNLENNLNVGLSGPIDINNPRIMTQSFVSRKHYEKLGYFFPKEIRNWYCDDWITLLYFKIGKINPLVDKYCRNMGGKPRYDVVGSVSQDDPVRKLCNELVERDFNKLI